MRIRIEYDPDTQQWASWDEDSGCASQGDTPGLALEAIIEAVDLYEETVRQIEAEGGTVDRG